MSSLPTHLIAGVLLRDPDRRYLLTRRAADVYPYAGLWVSPAGHVEDGERLEDAARRELAEETGIVVTTPLIPLGFADDITQATPDGARAHFVICAFLLPEFVGSLQLDTRELTAVAHMRISAMSTTPDVAPLTRYFAELAEDR